MTSRPAAKTAIRDLKSIDDLSQLKALEKQVWGMADDDALPLTLAIALKTAGNIFVGAFDKEIDNEKLVGFAFGFLGREHGQTTIHSHMLAVLDAYRHLDLGSRLKQAQRERAMAMGVHEMTWTYDPLQSRNAHFNFSKLGVVSDTYKVNFYGPETSSVLHRNGTDRLWVRWILNSKGPGGLEGADGVGDGRSGRGVGDHDGRDAGRGEHARGLGGEALAEEAGIASHEHAMGSGEGLDILGNACNRQADVGHGEFVGHNGPPSRSAKLDCCGHRFADLLWSR